MTRFRANGSHNRWLGAFCVLKECCCHSSVGGVLTMLTPAQLDINLTDMIYQPLLHIYFE